MLNKKLIFLDIDGTLTVPGENNPPESAVRAIRMAREKGHKVFLCSGRNYQMLSPLLFIDVDGIISSSGAYVEAEGQVIYDQSFTEEEQERILSVLEKNHIFYTLESGVGSYTDENFKEFLKLHVNEGSNSELLRWRRELEENLNIRPLEEYAGEPAYKVVFMCMKDGNLEETLKQLENDFTIVLQKEDSYGMINGEISAKDTDKGIAIRKVAEYLETDLSETVCFGDSMNDRRMMEAAGFSICMENGCEELKKTADEVCPSVQEDGIYRAFQRHGWCQ